MSNRETRLEFMTAPEIAEYMSELNLLYIPVAPLEWHGPHLPYGTDPLNAYAVCLEASRRFGGLVHPIVYAGTEVARRPELVEAFGLPSGTTVIGMDMPGFALKSFYMPPEQFRNCVRAVISTAASVGFSKIVVVNGHGADEQKRILKELALEMSGPDLQVYYFIALDTGDEEALKNIGHADRIESELTLANYPELVHIDRLPTTGGLKYSEYGIVDSKAFEGIPTDEFTTRQDPREASIEQGREMLEKVLRRLLKVVALRSD